MVSQSTSSHALDELSPMGEPVDGSLKDAPFRILASNEVLFREGDFKTHLYMIEEGIISVYRKRTHQPNEIIEFAFSGDVVGLGYLEEHTYWARSVVETCVRCLPLDALDTVLEDDSRTKQRYADAISREFEFRREFLVTALRRNPIGRLAAFFLALSQLNKNEGRDQNIITDSLECGVVAGCIGLDLDSLGQALVELEKKGLIVPCPPQGLRLNDLAGLEDLANETCGSSASLGDLESMRASLWPAEEKPRPRCIRQGPAAVITSRAHSVEFSNGDSNVTRETP